MKTKTKQMSRLIRQRISHIDSDADVLLYGSRARGSEHPESDWDILVLTDYPVDLEKESIFRDQLYELELDTGEPISVFVYSKNDWKKKQRITPFYQNVTEDGILL